MFTLFITFVSQSHKTLSSFQFLIISTCFLLQHQEQKNYFHFHCRLIKCSLLALSLCTFYTVTELIFIFNLFTYIHLSAVNLNLYLSLWKHIIIICELRCLKWYARQFFLFFSGIILVIFFFFCSSVFILIEQRDSVRSFSVEFNLVRELVVCRHSVDAEEIEGKGAAKAKRTEPENKQIRHIIHCDKISLISRQISMR